eukprot:m.237091 g.237091  ORF g.237091 m.237091 type:complete len:241 (+) comp18949_c0_seq12:32-754(+)
MACSLPPSRAHDGRHQHNSSSWLVAFNRTHLTRHLHRHQHTQFTPLISIFQRGNQSRFSTSAADSMAEAEALAKATTSDAASGTEETTQAVEEKFVCATPSCGKEGERSDFKRCGKCQLVVYCTRECQTKHWKGGHKTECRTPAQQAEDAKLEFFQKSHDEFRAVIKKYGLDKEDRADEISDFIVGAHVQDGATEFTAEEFAEKFKIDDVADAAKMLTFINIGMRFKESSMRWVDPNAPA